MSGVLLHGCGCADEALCFAHGARGRLRRCVASPVSGVHSAANTTHRRHLSAQCDSRVHVRRLWGCRTPAGRSVQLRRAGAAALTCTPARIDPRASESKPSHTLALSLTTTQVAVLYASDYGFSDRLSQTLAKGITKAGVKTEMVDLLSVDPQVTAVCGNSLVCACFGAFCWCLLLLDAVRRRAGACHGKASLAAWFLLQLVCRLAFAGCAERATASAAAQASKRTGRCQRERAWRLAAGSSSAQRRGRACAHGHARSLATAVCL